MKEHNNYNSFKRISAEPEKPLQYAISSIKSFGIALSFAGSEIQGKKAQTWLGYFVNLLQILLGTALYWLIFGVILNVNTGDIPFPLFVLTGMIPWVYFAGLVQGTSNSLIEYQSLLSKIYFPRTLIPLSKIFPGLIDFLIAICLTIIFLIFLAMPVRIEMLSIPLFLMILIFSGFSIGLWIASISVKLRDYARIIPYLINFGFFLTPVFYPTTIVPENINFIMYINPAALAVKGIRWAIFGSGFPEIYYLFSLIPVIILFIWGWRNFRKNEKKYADII